MHLTSEEKNMLEGGCGHATQQAMEFLVEIGNAYGAEKLLEVDSCHLIAFEGGPGKPGEIVFDLLSQRTNDAKVRCPTTVNPLILNLGLVEAMAIPATIVQEWGRFVPRLKEIHGRLGVIPAYSCDPFSYLHLRKGDHVAFTESMVATFANAWFGARTNVESGMSALASAITGRTPDYGLHLSKNRYGRILVEIKEELDPESFDYADYGAIGYRVGCEAGDRIPVYQGLLKTASPGEVKSLCCQILHSAAPIFHIIGVTPEAPTSRDAFGGKKPETEIVIDKRERSMIYQELCSATENKVDLVCFGCPHSTLQELIDIARLLEGKRISNGVRLWVGTSEATRVVANRMGLVGVIEEAGGLVVSDMCSGIAMVNMLSEALGLKVVATNSAALASYFLSSPTKIWFGRTCDCVTAAVQGKWPN